MRLAELVAALSLGVDLGFGQPMEHVLRQCLIALRLAEWVGLDEEERSVVYYTALLVNVGCHSDAHEQAKWFGDDIALKSGKYDHELGQLRAAAGGACGWLGSGNPPLASLPGRRWSSPSLATATSNGMIAQHSALARRLAEQLGLLGDGADGARRGLRAVGRRGWPGELKGEAIPVASRLAQIGGVRRGRPPRRWDGSCGGARPRSARARSSTPRSRRRSARNAEAILDGLDAGQHLGCGDRGRAGARRHALAGASSTPRCWRSPTSST